MRSKARISSRLWKILRRQCVCVCCVLKTCLHISTTTTLPLIMSSQYLLIYPCTNCFDIFWQFCVAFFRAYMFIQINWNIVLYFTDQIYHLTNYTCPYITVAGLAVILLYLRAYSQYTLFHCASLYLHNMSLVNYHYIPFLLLCYVIRPPFTSRHFPNMPYYIPILFLYVSTYSQYV